MPTVLNEYVGDGVSKSFNIAMEGGYLSRDYVKFYVRPVDALLDWTPLTNNDVTWTGDFSFTLATAIPVDSVLVVFRETPLTPLVDFQNTSRITEKNLDTGITQPLHKVAELTDLVDRGATLSALAMSTADTALGIAEGAEAVAAQAAIDAASAIATADGASAVASSALTRANQAIATANDASALATTADGNASLALTNAAAAVATANAASAAATTATSTANAANTTATTANANANAALVAATAANDAATQAAASATQAQSAATTAAAAASAAETAADNATAVATAADAAAATATGTANTALANANAAATQAADADTKATQALAQSGTAVADSSTALTAAQQAEQDAATALTTSEEALELIEQAVAGSVASFNGRAGNVLPQAGDYTAAMVGLGNVSNTADMDKPISTATQTALDEKAGAQDLADLATDIAQSLDPRISALETGKADTVHTHVVADVDGLQAALDGKAAANHTHAIANVTGLQAALDGKAASSHTHTIAQVTNLQTALDGKAASAHTHPMSDVVDLVTRLEGIDTAVAGKAAASHTHTIANVTGLQAALDAKQTSGAATTATFGQIELIAGQPFIDFHFDSSTADYTSRIIEAASGTLTCQGNWVASGNVTAYSDIRLKQDVVPIKYALAKVLTLGGYTYTMKATGQRQTGVVAQEVQQVLPEAVAVSPDGTLSVAYGNLVGVLIEAIKELHAKVETLEKGVYGTTIIRRD